eukprot:jgi/Psemu1/314972/fgenesh1_kg.1803_\
MVSACTPPRPEHAKNSKRAGQPTNDLFQKRVEITLEKTTKSVGVFSETYPTWLWYVRSRANASWLNSQLNVPGHGPEDPLLTKLDVVMPTTDLPLVEVILLQGSWNSIQKTTFAINSQGLRENSQEERNGNELPTSTMG